MNRNVVLSYDRDLPLLWFLWRWKLSTVAALTKKFYPTCSEKTAYNRLLALRQGKVIQMRGDSAGQKFICTLDQNGYDALAESLPPLKENGYKSERIGHDFVTTAFQLGEWLLDTPKTVEFFTEQQLRRIHQDAYPKWVPRSDLHRPDGYTRVESGTSQKVFSIEVELSNKRDVDYKNIGDFYNRYRSVTNILWLLPSQHTAHNIHQKMKAAAQNSQDNHSFVLVGDFLINGWESKIVAGCDLGESIRTVMGASPHEKPSMLSGPILTRFLLDTRKSPHTSVAYRGFQFGDFRD
jgi:hypothetical protein